MAKKRFRTCEIDQSRGASPPTQPHASSQPTHLAGTSQPHKVEDLSVQDHAAQESFAARIHEYAKDDFCECGASRWVTNDVDSEPNSGTSSKKPMQSNASSRLNVPENASQPQNVEDNRELDYNSDDDQFAGCEVAIAGESKKRGISCLADVWNLPPTKRIVVEFNQVFVPVGKEGGLFNRFLGTIARKPHLCPISYRSWHEVPRHYKEDCWNIIQSKFVIPETNPTREGIKHKTLKALGVKLRDWRFTLKNKHFDEAKTPAQIVAEAPPTVNREHYEVLVSYWFSNEGKDKMEDLIKSQPNSLEHTSKGSIFWSPNDVYSQVITKKERPGHRRGCGFGPTSKSSNSTSNDSVSFNVVDEEERMRDKETIRKLEEMVQAQMREMSTLKEQVAFLMRLMPGFTGSQVRDGCDDPPDQASPQTRQRSSHTSHDVECSARGSFCQSRLLMTLYLYGLQSSYGQKDFAWGAKKCLEELEYMKWFKQPDDVNQLCEI
ncbi:hypothetical protein Vadar_020772 [Vaccinium darrowii]|uniref:Uncharacterized protein n=1 Tax=Vaccinium darrowii TaxID=229202 RepID=A0ACB7XSB7_9ERIC|nr:hypothetical protein Vadar_020772 [Vaccinium darrowii]